MVQKALKIPLFTKRYFWIGNMHSWVWNKNRRYEVTTSVSSVIRKSEFVAKKSVPLICSYSVDCIKYHKSALIFCLIRTLLVFPASNSNSINLDLKTVKHLVTSLIIQCCPMPRVLVVTPAVYPLLVVIYEFSYFSQ